MPEPTPQQIQAAELAAMRIKGIILDMLMANGVARRSSW